MAEDSESMIITIAGTGEAGYSDGPAATATISQPTGVTLASDGSVYFCDTETHRIRMLKNGQVRTIAGGEKGFRNGPVAEALFSSPTGLIITSDGAIYICDTGNHCVRLLKDGQVTTFAGSGQEGFADGPNNQARFRGPEHIIFDKKCFYVSDVSNHCIRCIKNGKVTTVAGCSEREGYLDGPALQAMFARPRGLASGPKGVIYIADSQNDRIRMLQDGVVTTVAGNGLKNPTALRSRALEARFWRPCGLACTSDGILYIADCWNSRIRQLKEGFVSTIAGTDFSYSSEGPALKVQLHHPTGISVGFGGSLLYFADKHRIRTLRLARSRKPIDLSKAINVGSDLENIKIMNSSMTVHRCLVELRCPLLLSAANIQFQPLDENVIQAFQHWIYSDKLPRSAGQAGESPTAPKTWLGLAYMFEQVQLDELSQRCLRELQALNLANTDKNQAGEKLTDLYCYALNLQPFEDGLKVAMYLLRKHKSQIDTMRLVMALSEKNKLELAILMAELMSDAPAAQPISAQPKPNRSESLSLNDSLSQLFKTKKAADFTIEIEGEKKVFKCHHFVVAARWPYFAMLANAGMRETTEKRIHLPGPTQECGIYRCALEAVLQVCYLGWMTLPTLNQMTADVCLHLLTTSAIYFHPNEGDVHPLQQFIQFANKQVQEALSLDSCVYVYKIAHATDRNDVAEKARAFIIQNRQVLFAPPLSAQLHELPAKALTELLEAIRFYNPPVL